MAKDAQKLTFRLVLEFDGAKLGDEDPRILAEKLVRTHRWDQPFDEWLNSINMVPYRITLEDE